MAVREDVETRFDVTGTERYTGAMGVLARSASGAGTVLGRVLNVVNPLNTALAGLAAGGLVAGIAHISSEFENIQVRMAGTLQALGFVGTFESGMQNAANLTRQIHADAAALPGEAQDYVAVFTQALPQIQQSMGGSLSDMTDWSNRFTAIATSLSVDSAQAARDLQLMLAAGTGRAGTQVLTFQRMLPFIQSIEEHASITAREFNQMAQPQRWAIMNEAMELMNDMLAASAYTWEAITGATTTLVENLVRASTSTLFETMKVQLDRINDLVVNTNGEFTEFGQLLQRLGTFASSPIVSLFEAIGDAMVVIATNSERWIKTLMDSPIMIRLANLVDSLAGLDVGGLGGIAGGAGAALGMTETLAVGGIAWPALGAGFMNFLTRVEEVTQVLDSAIAIFQNMSAVLQPFLNFMSIGSTMMGDMYAGILPGLMASFEAISSVLGPFMGGMLQIVSTIFEALQPAFQSIWESLGRMIAAMGTLNRNTLVPLALAILEVSRFIAMFLRPQIVLVYEGLSWLLDGLASLLEWIAERTGAVVDAMAAENEARAGAPDWYNSARAAILGLAAASDEAAAAQAGVEGATAPRPPRAPRGRGGGRVVQDFRYSRFQIEQQFEQGFDPDRIAVAFASDLGAVGTRRLQSGFEPLFAIS